MRVTSYVGSCAVSPVLRTRSTSWLSDVAYPKVVCTDAERHDAQQAWQFGEVILLGVDGRVAAAVPTRRFDANLACEALRRVAKAVGADVARFWVSLSL